VRLALLGSSTGAAHRRDGVHVPFDVVASLAEDDLRPGEIATVYPSIDQETIGDAVSFAEQVTAVACDARLLDEECNL
jgi:hypothetical protein